jgi:glycosyltransferase involved in cell wall biosynthesis
MRVLMVSDDYLPNPGGIAAHVHELSCALAELGHEVDLVVGHARRNAGAAPAVPAGVRILSHRGFDWNSRGYLRMAFATSRMLQQAQRAQAYDVCHWHSLIWESWAVAFGARRMPRVFTNHSSGFLRRVRSPLRRHTQLRAILNVAHRVITPSRELLERSVDAGYPRDRLRYVPNGVDVRVFRPGTPDPELQRVYGLKPSDRVLVVPRRFDHKNGVDVLLRAIPEVVRVIPQLKLLLVGDGPEREALETLVREQGIGASVVFCGSQPRDRMVRHLQLAEIAVLPSRMEAVSLAGLEAMAVGLPVVGSHVGGIPEFVRDGENGLLVPVGDPRALAAALIRLLSDEGELRALAARTRPSVESDFSWRAAAEQTLEVYAAARAAS